MHDDTNDPLPTPQLTIEQLRTALYAEATVGRTYPATIALEAIVPIADEDGWYQASAWEIAGAGLESPDATALHRLQGDDEMRALVTRAFESPGIQQTYGNPLLCDAMMRWLASAPRVAVERWARELPPPGAVLGVPLDDRNTLSEMFLGLDASTGPAEGTETGPLLPPGTNPFDDD